MPLLNVFTNLPGICRNIAIIFSICLESDQKLAGILAEGRWIAWMAARHFPCACLASRRPRWMPEGLLTNHNIGHN